MKHIVIAGAGPVGLYLAIRLKQMGVKHITVVDPRAGTYTRDGVLDAAVFDTLQKRTGLPIQYSPSRHIKDAERALLEHAKKLGIVIKIAEASTVDGNTIKLISNKEEKSQNEESIPCDLAFDSTGPRRALIREVNRLAGKDVYNIEPAADNPIKNHFIAYVKMTPKNAALLSRPLDESSEPLTRSLALNALRSPPFDWPEFASPTFNYQILNKNKVCLYFETPPALKAADQEAWLTALLRFKTGKADISFEKIEKLRKFKKKPRFIPFTVDPHKATSKTYQADKHALLVIPIGDAQIEPDYRLGIGVTSGADRADALLKSLVIQNGEVVSFNLEQYHYLVEEHMRRHEKELTDLYSQRHDELDQAVERELKSYTQAEPLAKEPQHRESLKKDIMDLNRRQAMKAYQEAKAAYKSAVTQEGRVAYDRYGNILGEFALGTAEELFKKTHKKFKDLKINPDDLEKNILALAINYKEIGNKFFSKKNRKEARKYWEKALDLYQHDLPEGHSGEIIKLCSNLVMVLYEEKNYLETLQIANQALSLLPESKLSRDEQEKFEGKITYLKVQAILDGLKQPVDKESKGQNTSHFIKEIDSIPKMIALLEENASLKLKPEQVLKLNENYKRCQSVSVHDPQFSGSPPFTAAPHNK